MASCGCQQGPIRYAELRTRGLPAQDLELSPAARRRASSSSCSRSHTLARPAAASACGADPALLRRRQQPRHPPRPARAVEQAGQRRPLVLTRPPPATRPAADRRRRDTEASRHLPHRQAGLTRLRESEPSRPIRAWRYGASASGPSFGRRRGRRTASGRARTTPQPFTTCVGTSASPPRLRPAPTPTAALVRRSGVGTARR
jgi:hypothetical protein